MHFTVVIITCTSAKCKLFSSFDNVGFEIRKSIGLYVCKKKSTSAIHKGFKGGLL